MSFKQDIEFSRKCYIITEKVYKNHFGEKCVIKRTDDAKNPEDQKGVHTIGDYLDKVMNIDVIISNTKIGTLTMQEKVLRHDKLKYNCMTMEYMTDRKKKIKGEFFNITANLYLSGYLNETGDGFEKYCIIDVMQFKKFLIKQNRVTLRETSTSKANFIYINYNDLPDHVYFYKSWSK